jgi:glucosamine-6-phosphate deaminase
MRRARSPPRARNFFNLDEFVGLRLPAAIPPNLWKHLLAPLQVPPAQVRLLQGDAGDLAAECRVYDGALKAAGGLDLALLGPGTNGHIAFNEPGDDWNAATHVVTLAPHAPGPAPYSSPARRRSRPRD